MPRDALPGPVPAAPPDPDRLTRFLLPGAGVRGVRVHLDRTWQRIRGHGDDPAAVSELLGEACAAAALFTGHAKVEGRLSVQLRADAGLRTLFAECTAGGTLRGIARTDDGATVSRDLRRLGPGALLAITIENPGLSGREPMRYQGMVPLEAESLAGAFEDYFHRSEQLATRLLLAADDSAAAGLMVQKLPGDEGDADGWNRVASLFATLRPDELLGLSAGRLLHRLFHEEGPQSLDTRPLSFACSCSRGRVASMLESLGPDEARAALSEDGGPATVRCEFCGQTYRFSSADIDDIFTPRGLQSQAPERTQ